MIIKLVNETEERTMDEISVYGQVKNYRISTESTTSVDIDKYMEEHKEVYDVLVDKKLTKPIRRIFFELWDHDGWYEVLTNWKIYLMGDDGKTIESL